jgi:TonB-dependent receptor
MLATVNKQMRFYSGDNVSPHNLMKVMVSTCFILFFCTGSVYSQTGHAFGKVSDANTGKPLQGVIVHINNESVINVSDRTGHFSTNELIRGVHRLSLSTPGFAPLDTIITIESGTLFLDLQLVPTFTEIDDRYDKTLKFKQSQAFARQWNSSEIFNSISSSQMIREGDYTIQTGLTRVAGVQTGRGGELNIRGTGRDMFEVTIDGQRIASSSPAGRFVNPGSFSAVLAQDVDVVKVLTPYMDAEGIGGVVRINSWRPVGSRELTVHAGGMANPRYSLYSGLGNVMSLSYSERFSSDFAMAATISHQNKVSGYDRLEINYAAENFGQGYVDVIDRLAPEMGFSNKEILASTVQFSYQPNHRSSYYLQGLLNLYADENTAHRNVYLTGNDWINQTTTGKAGRRGSYRYDASLFDSRNLNFAVQAGGKNVLNALKIEYKAGWSRSSVDNSQFNFPFTSANLDYQVDMSNRTRPIMQITNVPLMQDGSLDRRLQNFQNMIRVRDEHEENRYSARLDFDIPIRNLNLKAGTSGLWTDKKRGFDDTVVSTARRYDLMRFEAVPRGSFNVFDMYHIPWIIYPDIVANFVNLNRPDLRSNADETIKKSQIWNNRTSEKIYGVYGMFTFNADRVRLSGGLRAEYTDGLYEGSAVVFNRFDTFISSQDTSANTSYLNLFPYAAVVFSPWNNSNLKLAYSKSIKRQDYTLLAPFELISAIDRVRFTGNTKLKPVTSNNLDILFEQYLSSFGQIVISGFYKELSNLAYLHEHVEVATEFPFHTVPVGQTIDVKQVTYLNSDKPAIVYGVEVSWQQYLDFVPDYYGSLGVFANYTWTESRDDRLKQNGQAFALMHQSPHVVNLALDYAKGRFSGSVAWHWSSESLYSTASQEQWAPALNTTQPIYLNQYEDGWTDVSASFGFRFSSNFRFWANAQNLLNKERILYTENRSLYPISTNINSGIRITAGLTFTI